MINKHIEYEIADFIFNVYETFRTWICPNIQTNIVCSYMVKVARTTTNTIYINIEDIINRYLHILDSDVRKYILETKRFILEVVVHELYHVEQDLINFKYNTDDNYKMNMEYQVIYMTSVFLLKNSYFIYNTFGVLLDEHNLSNKMNISGNKASSFYNRYINDSNSYHINMISGMIKKGSDLNVRNTIYEIDSKRNIIVILNGDEYIIKKDYIYNNNYNELNILNKYINCTSLIGEIKTKVLHKNDTCIIIIKDNTLKTLFTTLKEGVI